MPPSSSPKTTPREAFWCCSYIIHLTLYLFCQKSSAIYCVFSVLNQNQILMRICAAAFIFYVFLQTDFFSGWIQRLKFTEKCKKNIFYFFSSAFRIRIGNKLTHSCRHRIIKSWRRRGALGKLGSLLWWPWQQFWLWS